VLPVKAVDEDRKRGQVIERREREIAQVVDTGKTNREIATACYLSEKTAGHATGHARADGGW
jgi:DNA-binding NarL/FixJ family response regulator